MARRSPRERLGRSLSRSPICPVRWPKLRPARLAWYVVRRREGSSAESLIRPWGLITTAAAGMRRFVCLRLCVCEAKGALMSSGAGTSPPHLGRPASPATVWMPAR
ncbi:hypothetical protein MRX96_050839 [Rhipicephalus microplus]